MQPQPLRTATSLQISRRMTAELHARTSNLNATYAAATANLTKAQDQQATAHAPLHHTTPTGPQQVSIKNTVLDPDVFDPFDLTTLDNASVVLTTLDGRWQ